MNTRITTKRFLDSMRTQCWTMSVQRVIGGKTSFIVTELENIIETFKDSLSDEDYKRVDVFDASNWKRYVRAEYKPKDIFVNTVTKSPKLKKTKSIFFTGIYNAPLWLALDFGLPIKEAEKKWQKTIKWPSKALEVYKSEGHNPYSKHKFGILKLICRKHHIDLPILNKWQHLVRYILIYRNLCDDIKHSVNNDVNEYLLGLKDSLIYSPIDEAENTDSINTPSELDMQYLNEKILSVTDNSITPGECLAEIENLLDKCSDELESFKLLPYDIIYLLRISIAYQSSKIKFNSRIWYKYPDLKYD